MSLENYHWDRFYLHMYYHADIEDVFRAWATPKGQASFFVIKCVARRGGEILTDETFFQTGDTYEYLWEDSGRSQGEILSVDRENHTFVFSFEGAKVRIHLEKKRLGVLLELKHYDIPKEKQTEHQLDCRSGWTHFLINLKCVLEKNADVREKNPECGGTLGWGINPPQGLVLD